MELQGRLGELKAKGLGLAAISYDSQEVLAKFSRERGITFPLLSDVGSATIKRFGILNTVADEALGPERDDPTVAADIKRHVTVLSPAGARVVRGTPFPGTLVIDRDGRVTSRFFEPFYRQRITASAVLLRMGVGGQAVKATRVSTDHLELTTHSSDDAVSPGNRFTLVTTVTPRPGMHVYAPGASSYRVVTLRVADQPYVRISPTAYPPSETYFFKPLNERVPVYQRPFTLMTDVILDVMPEAEKALNALKTLTLAGALEYQACDDAVCYNPASIPMSWHLEMIPTSR